MCNVSGIIFGATSLIAKEVRGKRVLEVGALDVNGSLRLVLENFNPKQYLGVDIEMGPGVDEICDVQNLILKFGQNSFDLVVCTEVLEHVRDWRSAIHNLKKVCKTGGVILVTTRSKGHRYHGYPADFWRYEVNDMKQIFADCQVEKLESDSWEPGVFVKVRKPKKFQEKELSRLKLFSMVANRRVLSLKPADFYTSHFLKIRFKSNLKRFISTKPALRKFFEICSSLAQP